MEKLPHVVIVGAGFGGLYAAKALGSKPVRVTVVDRANHHLFQPLLYQVATAALSPSEIAEPIRRVVRKHRNVQVLLGEVIDLAPAERRVVLRDGELTYDYLILATGARHAYFGHPEWEQFAPGLKSLDDALQIRKRVLLAFEAAEREADPEVRRALLNFVIVGGGATGVEMAGAIAEIARVTIAPDFRSIDPRSARVVLIEAGPRVLPAFPEQLSAAAERSLERVGVEVRKGVPVSEVTPHSVRVGEEVIPTRCTIWAAGVEASPLGKLLGASTDRQGRVIVRRDLSVPGVPNVFVLGDLAHCPDEEGEPLPGLAPVAQQQGKWVAKNLLRLLEGRIALPFEYWDRGTMATIGRAAAVAVIGKVRLHGFFAWVAWLFVHVMWLIGFEHKVAVMVRWVYAYLWHGRSSRLITGDVSRVLPEMTNGSPFSRAGEVRATDKRFAASGTSPPAVQETPAAAQSPSRTRTPKPV